MRFCFAAVRWAGPFLAVWVSRCAGSCWRCYGGRKRGARNLDGYSGSSGCYFLFLCQSGQEHLLVGIVGISMDRDRCDFVFSWRSFCIRYGSTDRTDTGGCIFSDLQFPYESGRSGYLFEKSCNNGASAGATAGQNQSGYDVDRIGTDGGCDDRRAYLGLDQLIRQLGNTLKTVIRWLLLLIPNSPVEEETMATEQAQQAMRLPAIRHLGFWNCSISCWISLAG